MEANMNEASTQINAVRFHHETTCFHFKVTENFEYEIDCETCRTVADRSDWIRHLGEKNWGPAMIPDFEKLLTIHEQAVGGAGSNTDQ